MIVYAIVYGYPYNDPPGGIMPVVYLTKEAALKRIERYELEDLDDYFNDCFYYVTELEVRGKL